ncbi:hypothetical protein [Maribacter sp. 2308TA10-17]|uniref:hypothetical protein n=1 Tax=Maribacter sp. 2308TA10-17 TaxID=3386276 RepID=UPI0039BC6977
MKRILYTFAALILFTSTYAQESLKTIKGKIMYLDGPVANAEIKVSNSDALFKSTKDGAYEVQAYQGDIITFSYPSLRDMEVVVEDVTRILNITMSADINELDEVVVEASKRRGQREMEEDYGINKRIIKTAWGFLDADRASGQIRILEKKEISNVYICILDLLKNRFASIGGTGDCMQGGSLFLKRATGSISQTGSLIYDVDGQILTGAPTWIDVNSIERIAVLSSLATTATYGSVGSGGVIVINTTGGTASINSVQLLDRARLRNNIYQDNALSTNEVDKNLPTYLLDYRASSSREEAKLRYKENLKKYYNSPHFFIDSYSYFLEQGEDEFAADLLTKNIPLFNRNSVYLKAMAYAAEANDKVKISRDLYEQVFILRPNYGQSYRDLAESYRDIKNHKKAAAMYARYNYLVDEGFLQSDSVGLGAIIDRESENLLALEGDKFIEGKKAIKRLAKYTDFKGTRLLFEWNDGEAEFELQFVNPEKHYYTWKHTMESNSSRIMDEKIKGYSSEEFLIDGSLAGKWQVNIDYRGNKKLEPTYLKVTTYFNYGLASQRKDVKVYRLTLKNNNYKLFDLVNSGNSNPN